MNWHSPALDPPLRGSFSGKTTSNSIDIYLFLEISQIWQKLCLITLLPPQYVVLLPTDHKRAGEQHSLRDLSQNSKPPQQKQNHPQQHQASSQLKSATQPDIAGNSFISTLSTVSLELSKGIEHPEIYLDILNILLTHHGYANITIPKHAIDMSKNIFNHHHPGVTKTTIPFSVLHRAPPSSPVFPITVHTTK